MSRSAKPRHAWQLAQTLATSPGRLSSQLTWPRYASFASFPWPFTMQHRLRISRRPGACRCAAARRGSRPWDSTGVIGGRARRGVRPAASRSDLQAASSRLPDCVPSTVKCSSESRPAARAGPGPHQRRRPRHPPADQPVTILGKRRGIARPGRPYVKPTNQRNSRLSLSSSDHSAVRSGSCTAPAATGPATIAQAGVDGRPVLAYRPANTARHRLQRVIRQRADRAERIFGRHALFRRQVTGPAGANRLPASCGSCCCRSDWPSIAVDGVLQLVRGVVLLPGRLLGGPRAFRSRR